VTDQNVTDQNVTDQNVTDQNVTDSNVTDSNVKSESEQSSKLNSGEQVNNESVNSGEQVNNESVNSDEKAGGEQVKTPRAHRPLNSGEQIQAYYKTMYEGARGVISLCTITQTKDPDQRSSLRTKGFYDTSRIEDIIAEANKLNGRFHIYTGIHPLRERPGEGRGKEKDILGVAFFAADVDAKDFIDDPDERKKAIKDKAFYQWTDELLSECKAKVLAHIHSVCSKAYLPPTAIIDSGHGFYPVFKLSSFIEFASDQHREEIKEVNKAFHSAFAADSTFDFARILRVVGTRNIKPGYPADCKLIEFHPDKRYTLDDIRKFETLTIAVPSREAFRKEVPKEPEPEPEAQESAEDTTQEEAENTTKGKAEDTTQEEAENTTQEKADETQVDVDLSKFDLSKETIHWITTGKWAEGKKDKDGKPWTRSERDHSVVCRLVALGATDDEIKAIFFLYPVGDKYREPGNGDRYLFLSIAKARESQEKVAADLKAQIAKIRRRKKAKAFDIKHAVSELIINDMKERGKFYQTNEDVCYYFDEEQKRLSRIGDDRRFGAQIEDVYGINPSEQEYQFLIEAIITETLKRGDLTIIQKFAFYDTDANRLYVYDNNNGIYRLDGKEIKLVSNGFESVLFLSDPLCEPFEYVDTGSQKFLRPKLITPINFSSGDGVNLDKEEQQWLFVIDIYTKFFETLMPTKPIVAFIGPKGSGKTMAQRLIMKVLFGKNFDVTSITKEDDFDAAVTANYIVAFDNVDGEIDWLNDKLAHTATGKMIQKRELYTTNRNIRYFPKCFLMVNARSPRFKREDVTDRLLLFRTEPIEEKRSEAEIIGEVMDKRNEIWSDLLNNLNIIVKELATEKSDFTTAFRMADWAKLGWQITRKFSDEKTFVDLLSKMDKAQSEFLLEDNPIFLCLSAWLAAKENVGREVTSSTLYNDFQIIAVTLGISFTYKNTKSFGIRLRNIIEDLRSFFDVKAEKYKNRWMYVFRHKG